MTDIVIKEDAKSFQVSLRGHCERDVCIAVSALTNTLAQYTEDFRDKYSGFRTDALRTVRGNALISVFCEDARLLRRYMNGARAICLGLELYAHHFPEDISLDSGKNQRKKGAALSKKKML